MRGDTGRCLIVVLYENRVLKSVELVLWEHMETALILQLLAIRWAGFGSVALEESGVIWPQVSNLLLNLPLC